MRRFLILAAGAALAGPVFAQDYAPPAQTYPGQPPGYAAYPAPEPNEPMPAPPPGAPNAYGPDYGPGVYPAPQPPIGPGARLYVRRVQVGGQTVDIVSNGPVADTPRTRAKYPPMSNAGRRTAPAGN